MTLITRISRLLKADLHGLLDSLEEPSAIVRQSIREMEEEVKQAECAHHGLRKRLDDLARRRDDSLRRLNDIEARLDVCFKEASEELTRKLIRRKLEAERLGELLRAQNEKLQRDLEERARSLAEQKERLRTVQEKWEVLRAATDERAESASGREEGNFVGEVRDEEVEAALIAERLKRQAAAVTL